MFNIRQGDVAIKGIDKLPTNLKKIKGNVVAHGESGHFHTLVKDKPETLIELFEDTNGQKYIKIKGGTATLTHQEHKPIQFGEGVFVMGKEREFDTLKGWRETQD